MIDCVSCRLEKLGGFYVFSKIDFQPKFSERPLPIDLRKGNKYWNKIKSEITGVSATTPQAYDYKEFVDLQISKDLEPYTFPAVTPMWDNSARRDTGYFILHNSTPAQYGRWLEHETSHYDHSTKEESFLFINAWNEWAEGNHLEPCQKWGREYLEVTRQVLGKTK